MAALAIACTAVANEPLIWRRTGPDNTCWYHDAIFWNGTFIVVGDHARVAVSVDGEKWESGNAIGAFHHHLRAVAAGAGTLVVAGHGGARHDRGVIFTKTGAAAGTAQECTPGHIPNLFGAAYGNGRFVVVGADGAILDSPAGTQWTLRQSGTECDLHDVACGPAGFAACGSLGVILVSNDGATWAAADSGTTDPLWGVAASGAGFVAVGWKGLILTSDDGIAWRRQAGCTEAHLRAVTWGGGRFVACGDDGAVVASGDGIAWEKCAAATGRHLRSVAEGNGVFIACGWLSAIIIGQ